MNAQSRVSQNPKAQVNLARRIQTIEIGRPAPKPNGGLGQPLSESLGGMPPLDQSHTDQLLSAAKCINPSSEDIVGVNTIIVSAATHIATFLNKNPAAHPEVSKGFSDVMALIQCADSLGWKDDGDSILRSIGYEPNATDDNEGTARCNVDTSPANENEPAATNAGMNGANQDGHAAAPGDDAKMQAFMAGLAEKEKNVPTPPAMKAGYGEWPDGVNGETHIPKRGILNTIEAIKRLGLTATFDEFRQKEYWTGHKQNSFNGEVSDEAVTLTRRNIREEFGFYPSKDMTYEAITCLCRDNSTDPVLEYFGKLKWDGVPRLDTMLHKYLGADGTALNAAIGRKMMCATIRPCCSHAKAPRNLRSVKTWPSSPTCSLTPVIYQVQSRIRSILLSANRSSSSQNYRASDVPRESAIRRR